MASYPRPREMIFHCHNSLDWITQASDSEILNTTGLSTAWHNCCSLERRDILNHCCTSAQNNFPIRIFQVEVWCLLSSTAGLCSPLCVEVFTFFRFWHKWSTGKTIQKLPSYWTITKMWAHVGWGDEAVSVSQAGLWWNSAEWKDRRRETERERERGGRGKSGRGLLAEVGPCFQGAYPLRQESDTFQRLQYPDE